MKEQPRYKLKIIVLLSVLLTALLLCSTIVISIMLRSSIRRQMTENGGNTLAQLRSSTETILGVMDDALVQVSLDAELQNFADRYELMDIFDCEDLYKRLYQFRATNRFIEKLYIDYYTTGQVLDTNGKDPRLTGREMLEDAALLALAAERTLAERYVLPVTLFNMAGEGEETLLCMTKAASPIASRPNAVIVVTMRQDYFQDLMQSISLDEACDLYVLDREGRYLFGKNGAVPERTLPVLSITNTSESTGWTYCYEIPERVADLPADRVTRLLWAVTAGMMALSFVGILFLSQELYKPVKLLMEDKAAAERLLEENKPFLREDTVRRLLEPSETTEEEWRALLTRYGASCFPEGCYAAAVLAFEQFEGYIRRRGESAFDELMLYKLQQLQDLGDHLEDGRIEFVRDRRKGKFILILSFDTVSPDRAEKRIDELAARIFPAMREDVALPVTMGVGHAYRQLANLCASYEEAVAAYQYRTAAGDDRVLYARDLPDVQERGFLFPNRLAAAALNAVKLSDRERLDAQLGQLFAYVRDNLRPGSHPSYVAVQLFNTVLQFLQELSIDAGAVFEDVEEESAAVLRMETLDALECYFRSLFFRLQDYLSCRRAMPGDSVSDRIRAFLDSHFADDGMSLDTLAGEMHFSASYLARTFKNDTGKSIKEYVTERRIEEAKRLLADKGARVGEVAVRVGYANPRSFINMFKKYTGLTPGEYKEGL